MNFDSRTSSNYINPMRTIFISLAISVAFMALGFFVGLMVVPMQVAYMANRVISVVFIGLFVLSIFSRKGIIPRRFSIAYVYAFTFIYGIVLYPIFLAYLQVLGISVFFSVMAGGVGIFVVLAIQASRKEAGYYMSMGNVLFAGLIGIIIASVINIFFFSNLTSAIISVIGVVIFAGYTMYDISIMKYAIQNGAVRDRNDLSIFVLNLYFDFINLILNLLNIASFLDN